MEQIEKLGAFYLGRTEQGPLLYDSKDLVTHAVCVGMTGSGKTGLCIGLLEEAAIDNIPAIVIDPKGDLTNLLLTFPNLAPEDFLPWINSDDAQRKGLTPEQYAAAQAKSWEEGLSQWGQDKVRIAKLKDAADFTIYTPGSNAGMPVSALKSFAAPPPELRDDREAMRDRVMGAASALLGLIGIDADPIQSREHILLSTIFNNAWQNGEDLDLAGLIQRIQDPPVKRIGVLDLEGFYPAKDRFGLAMSLNNLLASPGFESWLEGDPLDIGAMLHTPQGKPRISIFSIAHLSDAERMFFVSLLLNQTVSWMRTQPGTTSLRAIVYMDEIFGYFPPVANPPSKQPLLTLLKQARAFGVGVVLATQNPVDLDYKGLSNAGTWFVGRLQTERDKARLIEGLEGAAAAGAHGATDRGALEKLLSSLGKRVFLMNNVHDGTLQVFESRWALSYLCGPLTRTQIKSLMDAKKAAASESAADAPVRARPPGRALAPRPVLPPEIGQRFLPPPTGASGVISYQPAILGALSIRFTDTRTGIDTTREVTLITPVIDDAVPVEWPECEPLDLSLDELQSDPAAQAEFATLAPAAAKAKSYAGWQKDLITWAAANRTVELFSSTGSGVISNPDESEKDFRTRLAQTAREARDAETARIRGVYGSKIASLEEKVRRADMTVEKEQQEASSKKMDTALSIGASLLGAFLGGKMFSRTNVRSVTTAARSVGRSAKEASDVGRARENADALRQELEALKAQSEADVKALQARIDPASETFEKIVIRPKKTNIAIKMFLLVWRPR
jgi:hypothetical protein